MGAVHSSDPTGDSVEKANKLDADPQKNLWSNGGNYLAIKSQPSYDALNQDLIDLNNLDGLTNGTSAPDVCINYNVIKARTSDAVKAYAGGAEWLYTGSCASQVMQNNSVHHWADDGAVDNANVTACTDGKNYGGNKNITVPSFTFYTNTVSKIATVTVMIALGSATGSQSDPSISSVYFDPKKPLYDVFQTGELNKLLTIVGGAVGSDMIDCNPGEDSIEIFTYTADQNVKCTQYNYGLGFDGKGEPGDNTNISFQVCTIPKQYKDSCGCDCKVVGDCVCSACIAIAAPDQNCQCMSNISLDKRTCVTSTVDKNEYPGAFGVVYRDSDMFFAVPIGDDNAVCENDTTGTKCIAFNGIVAPRSTPGASIFTEEPSPFVTGTDDSIGAGKVFGVLIQFSLTNIVTATDAESPENNGLTYLQRLLDCRCGSGSTPTGASCDDYSNANNWNLLLQMWTSLNRFSTGTETVYQNFALKYYGYTCVQLYFLSMYNYCGNISDAGTTRYSMFFEDLDWNLGASAFSNMFGIDVGPAVAIFDQSSTDMFTKARPQIATMDPDKHTIEIELTVPSILFNVLFCGDSDDDTCPADLSKQYGNMNKDAVSAFLLRLFPETEQVNQSQGTGFQPRTYFINDGTDYTDIVNGKITPPVSGSAKFDILSVPSSASQMTFFWFDDSLDNSGNVVLKQGSLDPSNPPKGTPILGVRFSVTMQLHFPTEPSPDPKTGTCGPNSQECMTLLFYLRYTQLHRTGLQVCNNMFIDNDAARLNFMASPDFVNWPAACEIVQRRTCDTRSDASLTYFGPFSELVNNLFLSSTSPTCSCIEGSNLPTIEQDKEMNAAAMCFNVTCNRPPVCLSNILSNRGDGSDCDKDDNKDAYDCSQHCKEYINVLEDYRDDMDFDMVDWSALSQLCNYDPRKLLTTPSVFYQYYVAAGLVAFSMPVLYGIVALICYARSRKEGGKPFGQSVAAEPTFWVPLLILFLFLAGGTAFVLFDFQPRQYCTTPLISKGFAYPSSKCMIVESKLYKLITSGEPKIEVPQDFCFAEPRSYCEHFDNTNPDSPDPGGDKQGCNLNATQLCPVEGADGLCVHEKGSPYLDRSIRIQGKVQKYNLVILVLCIAIAIFAVPIVALSCWFGLDGIVGNGGRITITVLLSLLALCASFTYMLVQYLQPAKYKKYEIGMGTCGALDNYPSTLIAMSTPPGLDIKDPPLKYVASSASSGGAPVYVTRETDKNIPSYIYLSGEADSFGMYSGPPPSSSSADPPTPTYVNDTKSAALTQFPDAQKASNTHTLLHESFILSVDNYDNPFIFCGRLDKESSCGASSSCPCAPPVPSAEEDAPVCKTV